MAGVVAVVLAGSACSLGGAVAPPAGHSASAPVTAAPSPTAAATCAARVLAGLTLDQRIGQLLFVGLAQNQLGAAERAAIVDDHVGAVWYTELSAAPAASVAAVSASVQALAPVPATGRLTLFVGANQEGGQIDQFHGPGFSPIPSALAQGSESPPQLEADAYGWGRQLMAAGIHLEVAPVLDTVPPGTDAANAPIGALQREYGHDPATVTAHGVAFLTDMQRAGQAVTVKHFPGLGRVAGDTDFTAAVVDTVTTADDPYLKPFAAGIGAGTDMVMVSLALYTQIDPQRLAAFSPVVIGLVRGRYRFAGVIVSDDLGAAVAVQVIPPGQRAVDFIAAGGDLVTVKYASLVPPMAVAIRARADADAAFRQTVDAAALRVLELKARRGLICG
ncbi:MAG: glycoside hydrolase family 3 N-terminal domain-containing protein [Chloroflexota bacterium]